MSETPDPMEDAYLRDAGREFMAKKVTILKDSGTRSTFDTGAVRDGQTGKGRMDLLPVNALIEVSKIFEAGAEKYEARNWEKGIPLSRFMDSGLRHAMKWLRGDRDESHLAQACWNFLCLLDTQQRIEEGLLPMSLNDIPYNHITPQSRIADASSDKATGQCGKHGCTRYATFIGYIGNTRVSACEEHAKEIKGAERIVLPSPSIQGQG
jgi:hypothetical protein